LSEDFVKVAEAKDIEPSSMKAVDIGAEKICIINIEGNFYGDALETSVLIWVDP
jgi:nitrite reductase/ring-hydroxylating ferredoxin subunit